MTSLETRELSTISHLLAAGLSAVPAHPLDMPLEVARSLAEAQAQMQSLPEVIRDLNLAGERFQTVSGALAGMIGLADRAAAEETDDAGRRRLHEEFADLAKVVADDAGRRLYQGPSLNLKSRAQALSAARIIRYLEPAIETMERELGEQKRLIQEAVAETINFLRLVAECYPEAQGAEALSLLAEAAEARQTPISPAAARLH